MCNPMAIGVGLMAGGMMMNSVSAGMQAEAQNAANEYNAQIMEKNAELAKADADFIEKQGTLEESNLRKKAMQFRENQKAAFVSAGVMSNSGSAKDLQNETDFNSEVDAMTLRANNARQANNVRQQGFQYGMQASMTRMGNVDPGLASFTSLLGGGSQLGSMLAMKYG